MYQQANLFIPPVTYLLLYSLQQIDFLFAINLCTLKLIHHTSYLGLRVLTQARMHRHSFVRQLMRKVTIKQTVLEAPLTNML